MDPISLVITAFIRLLERITDLEKTRLQNKEEAFKEIVEPLFMELGPVVDNYFSLFKRARQAVVESQQNDLWDAVREIRDARDALILNRIKVREMANRIQDIYNDKKIVDFAQKVDGFFYRTIMEKQTRGKSYAKELVDLFEYVVKHDMNKNELIQFIDDALDKMMTSWITIAQSYAAVRIYCLSSPRLINQA